MAGTSADEVVKVALSMIGEQPVDGIDEDSPIAATCRIYLPFALKAILERYPWRFAQKRVVLAHEDAAPVFGFAYQFVPPADFISVTQIDSDRDSLYSVEDNRILSDSETISLQYTAEQVKYSAMPSLFSLAFAAMLGMLVAGNTAGGDTKVADLERRYLTFLNEAILFDKRTGFGVSEESEYQAKDGSWLTRNG